LVLGGVDTDTAGYGNYTPARTGTATRTASKRSGERITFRNLELTRFL